MKGQSAGPTTEPCDSLPITEFIGQNNPKEKDPIRDGNRCSKDINGQQAEWYSSEKNNDACISQRHTIRRPVAGLHLCLTELTQARKHHRIGMTSLLT